MHLRLSFALIVCHFLQLIHGVAHDPARWRRQEFSNTTQSLAPANLLPSTSSSSSIDPPSVSANDIPLASGAPVSGLGSPNSSISVQSSSSSILLPSAGPNDAGVVSNDTAPIDSPSSNSTTLLSSSSEPSNSSSLNILSPTGTQDDGTFNTTGSSNSSAATSGLPPGITPPPSRPTNGTLSIPTNGTLNTPTNGTLFNQTSVPQNQSCGGCVVNAQAGVDWWYPANIYEALASVSTITMNGSNSYTMVPVQTTVDVDAELLSLGATFVLTESFDPVQNSTVDNYVFTTPPLPIAASTSIFTQSDVNPMPTTIFGTDQLNTMYPDSTSSPSIVIANAVPTPISATQYDNIAYYTAYEVEFDAMSTDDSGNVVCGTSTSTFVLDAPYAYTLDPAIAFGDSAMATGDVDPGFLSVIPYSTCTPGIWLAAPVMIVVIEVTYQRGFSVFLVHHEVSDPGTLDTPTVTAAGAAATTSINVVPAVAHIENTDVTFIVSVTGNPASVTVPVGGSSVVASVVGGGTGGGNTNGNGNAGAAVASAIIQAIGGTVAAQGAASPTNVNGVGLVAATASSGSGSNGGSGGVPVLTIGGQTFVGNQATQFVVASGQTLTPGGVATVGTNTVSLASNGGALVINGQTSQVAVPAATPLPAIDVGGQTVTANSGGSFIVSGQTLTQGGQITVGSNTISLANGGSSLVVNGQTITAPPVLATGSPVITVDGSTFAAQNGGESFIIAGQTLTPGGIITANGNTISLGSGSNPSTAVVNGQTVTLAQIFTPAAVNVAGTNFPELPGSSFVIDGQTLLPGSQIVVAGTTLSLAPGASFIVVNGQTSVIAVGTIPALVLGGTTYAETSGISGAYVIGGQTLTPGGVITVNGHTISLASGGTALVIDGSTSLLNVPTTTLPPLLTIGGHTYTANSGTTYVIDGLTLTPGGFIVDHGTTISLSPHATALVVNGKTTTLFPATKTPQAASAIATKSSTTKFKTPSGPTKSGPTATSTKKGAASSVSTNLGFTIIASVLGALFGIWM